MSYKEKPQLKLYAFSNNEFVLQAIIDDYQECSFERNLYQAGTFTVTINYNIPNSHLFQRGLFIQFGNDPYDFGEIITVQDSIGQDGKGSQIRTITGYDARYLLKRRIIKNMNSNGLWVMTAKGELCLRNLIKDQCGSGAEEKRRLPITNVIPSSANAIGEEYSVSEQFTNLYEVCSTIATQSEIGWRIGFDGTSMYLNCYKGTDRSQTVQFSTSFDSLANGKFVDSSESFCNAVYVGGKGDNEERDIYEGENGTPSGLDRFESWDNQAQMTTEEEYEIESKSILSQYGQTVDVMGNGLAKCPYIYKEQYNVGDLITIAFSGKSAVVQILSVTERWAFGNYDIQFSFGKPINGLTRQLQNMLRKIQEASNKTESTTCVKWYTVTNTNSMPKADVTFNTLGFTGAMTQNKTFTLYLDNERTGSKNYTIYTKNLTGNYTLTLTTGRSGATNFVLKGGVNAVAKIYIDPDGNIIESGMTATSVIESGNNQPLSSDGATALQPVDTVASGNLHSVTSNAVFNGFLNPALIKMGAFGVLGGSNEFPSSDTPIGADDLVEGLAHKSGMCSGSTVLRVNQLGVDCVGSFEWVNFIYIPHRNGLQNGDNPDYGVCFIIPMTNEYLDTFYIVHRIGGRNRTAIRYEPNITRTAHVTITTDGNGNGYTGYTTSSDYMPIGFKPIGTTNYPTIITCDNSGNYWLKPFDWGNFVIKPNFTLEGDLILQRQK